MFTVCEVVFMHITHILTDIFSYIFYTVMNAFRKYCQNLKLIKSGNADNNLQVFF
jgi:hypothetical protein